MNNSDSGTNRQPISAYTREPNTQATDLMANVWHIVTDSNGIEHEVFSSDPLTAIEDFRDGKAAICRSANNLNKEPGQYSSYPAEEAAFECMFEAAIRVGLRWLEEKPGAYAEIQGAWWWVSPVNGKLEVVCSPDSDFSQPENCTFYMVSGFEGQSADDLTSTMNHLLTWIKEPVIAFGNQLEMDNLAYFSTSSSSNYTAPTM